MAPATEPCIIAPLPGEAGLCQFAAALPGQSAPAAQGSFTLVGMSLSPQSFTSQLFPGTPQTNTVTLSNLTSVALSGISATVMGQPANVSVQVTTPSTLGGKRLRPAPGVCAAIQFPDFGHSLNSTIQFTSAQGTTNDSDE